MQVRLLIRAKARRVSDNLRVAEKPSQAALAGLRQIAVRALDRPRLRSEISSRLFASRRGELRV